MAQFPQVVLTILSNWTQILSVVIYMQVKINNTEDLVLAHHFFPTSSQPS